MTVTEKQISDSNAAAAELTPDWLDRLQEIYSLSMEPNSPSLPELVLATIPHAAPPTPTESPEAVLEGIEKAISSDVAKIFEPFLKANPSNSPAATAVPSATKKPEDTVVESFASQSDASKTDASQAKIETIAREQPTTDINSQIPKRQSAPSAPSLIRIDEIYFDLGQRTTLMRVNRLIDRLFEKLPPPATASIVFGECESFNDSMIVALQTAYGLSKRHQDRVLLVDVDADASLTSEFKMRNEIGLIDLIESPGDCEFQTACQRTSVPNLDFLPLGGAFPAATGRDDRRGQTSVFANGTGGKGVSTTAISRLFNRLKSQYQYICVCAGNLNDRWSMPTACGCDAAYVVVDLEQNDTSAVEKTVSRLKNQGVRTLGCVSLQTSE